MKFLVYAFLILYSGYSFSAENIRLVIASGAGGIVHRYALKIAPVIAKEMNVKVIIELKPGAEGYLAASHVSKQENDNDITLLIGTPQKWKNIPNARLSHIEDFKLISLLGSSPSVIVSAYGSKYDLLYDFLRASFKEKVTYATSATNQIRPLMRELIEKYGNKENFTEITYKSGSDAVNAVIGNHIDFAISVPESTLMHAKNKRLKIIGVLSLESQKELSHYPTLKQQHLSVDHEFKYLPNIFLWSNLSIREEDFIRIKNAISEYLSSDDFNETKKTTYISLPKDFYTNSEKYLKQILE